MFCSKPSPFLSPDTRKFNYSLERNLILHLKGILQNNVNDLKHNNNLLVAAIKTEGKYHFCKIGSCG